MEELNDLLIGSSSHAKNAIGDWIEATVAAASEEDEIPTKVLISMFAEFRNSHIKAAGTIRSVSGLISSISSSILIWMILRSHIGLSTSQHRLLLGLCISDLFSSLSYATFNMAAPSDNDYMIWNARGTEATCDAQGFFVSLGGVGGLFYNSSLTLYYLAVVRYNKSDDFIRARIEPFLHIFPIAIALSYSITRLVLKHYNADDSGFCTSTYHYPPHCQGYDVGDIRDGFNIPCGRGIEGAGSTQVARMSLVFIPAIIMILSLGIIYGIVWKQERKLERYGVGALSRRTDLQQQQQQSAGSGMWGKISTSLSNISWRSSRSNTTRTTITMNRSNPSSRFNDTRSRSRAVMHKAFAYSFAWLLSYGCYLIAVALFFAGKGYPLFLAYMTCIFIPLQGFFNLLIYMYPKIVHAKNSRSVGGENVTWSKAFSTAFWSRGNAGRKKLGVRTISGSSNLRGNRTKRKANDSGHTMTMTTTAHRFEKTDEQRKLQYCQEDDEEEQKCEIQIPDDAMPHKKILAQSTYARNVFPVQASKSMSIYIPGRLDDMASDAEGMEIAEDDMTRND